jgi:hypothetical protein
MPNASVKQYFIEVSYNIEDEVFVFRGLIFKQHRFRFRELILLFHSYWGQFVHLALEQ